MVFLIYMTMLSCRGDQTGEAVGKNVNFRILGYLPSKMDWATDMAGVDFNAITDLNLAFINPDSTGKLPAAGVVKPVIEKAHKSGVRIFLSIGGGSPLPHMDTLLYGSRKAEMIKALANYTVQHQFDGIDVDLENDLINEHYAPFVKDLHTALKAENKLMTAALATWNGDKIHDSTLQLYDYINIMSYDKTGPWQPGKAGQHSPLSMATDDFNYYHQKRNIPAEKLLVGLPFYGYVFGVTSPYSMKYRDILAAYPGSENADSLRTKDGGTLYFNGIPTIRQKTLDAINNKAAGVMIWQLLGDSNDDRSLLRAIKDAAEK